MRLILHFHFSATFGGKMGVTAARAYDLGSSNQTKEVAHWMDLLGKPLSRNHVFAIFRGGLMCQPLHLLDMLAVSLFGIVDILYPYLQ